MPCEPVIKPAVRILPVNHFCQSLCALLCLGLGSSALAQIVTGVVVNEKAQKLPDWSKDPAAPVILDSSARNIRFSFKPTEPNQGEACRLRYKLEGYDRRWNDLPFRMGGFIQFLSPTLASVGSTSFYMRGETPGWRGRLEDSDFVPHTTEEAIVPEEATSARVVFVSNGDRTAIGLAGLDAIYFTAQGQEGEAPRVFDLNIHEGTRLNEPDGQPANWKRTGSLASMAELRTRLLPSPHPILAFNDVSDSYYAQWIPASPNGIPVRPGDRVRLQWDAAYSIGGCTVGNAGYFRLNPGSYFFRVATTRLNGEPTGTEVVIPVLVRVPVHQDWRFWLLIGLCALACIGWTSRWALKRRMQQRMAEMHRQRAMERERERIARDLHDNIGAGLTEIAMQSDWVDGDLEHGLTTKTRKRVQAIRRSATELARSIDAMVWAVNPANDNLRAFVNYLTQYCCQFLHAAKLRLRFDIPSQVPELPLPGQLRHTLFLGIREALNNVVKHAKADLVHIDISWDQEQLRIVIEDDGLGFDPNQKFAEGVHEGLENIRRRLAELGGHHSLKSTPGHGTRIELSVPLPDQHHAPK